MSEREFVLRDETGDRDTILLITPDTWTLKVVQDYISGSDYSVYEFSYWSTKMVNDNTLIMTIEDWENR